MKPIIIEGRSGAVSEGEAGFWLSKSFSRDSDIFLMGKDYLGGIWYVIKITPDGIERCVGIAQRIGWPLDPLGKIHLIEGFSRSDGSKVLEVLAQIVSRCRSCGNI